MSPQWWLYSFRAQNEVERLSPVDPGISRGVTYLYPSRGYTHPVSRAIEVSYKQLAKLSFDRKTFLVDLTAEVCFFFNRYVLRPRVNMPCIHIPRNVLGVSLVTDVVCFNVWNLESDGMRRWPRGPPLSLFFSSLLILRQMGGKKAQAHYTSMYFHTCRVSI